MIQAIFLKLLICKSIDLIYIKALKTTETERRRKLEG